MGEGKSSIFQGEFLKSSSTFVDRSKGYFPYLTPFEMHEVKLFIVEPSQTYRVDRIMLSLRHKGWEVVQVLRQGKIPPFLQLLHSEYIMTQTGLQETNQPAYILCKRPVEDSGEPV